MAFNLYIPVGASLIGPGVALPVFPVPLPPLIDLSAVNIFRLLGYRKTEIGKNLIIRFRQDLQPAERIRAENIVSQLNDIDGQLLEAVSSSAIVKTCNSELNWTAHIKTLQGQAHYLLEELAVLFDIELARSKYRKTRSCVSIQYQ